MRELRKSAELRQVELAAELGLDNQTICNWELRNTELPKVYGESVDALAKDVERIHQIKRCRKAKKWRFL
jgi:DNA-binding XRE family transcriptional regulator